MLWLTVAIAVSTGARSAAAAAFTFLTHSAVFDAGTGNVSFVVRFSEPPDFFTLDKFGRQAHSFQYFIVGDPTLPYPELYDSIVRGEEIHITGGTLRIRNAHPPDPDPAAGGWGAIRGAIPFLVNDDTLTFEAPLALLSDHSTDGRFEYRLESYAFGELTRFELGESTVPEPRAAAGAMVALVLHARARLRNVPKGG
jgi:hypothetical protein